MANPNTPYGLRPYAYMSGAPYNGAVRTYYVPAGNATALYIGDPVAIVPNSSDGNGVPTAEIATAGAGANHFVLGAYLGRSNNAGQGVITVTQDQSVYLPASTAAYIYVCDDPFLLYAIQEDGVGGAITSNAAAGANGDLIAGAGSTFTSQSGWQLDSSTVASGGGDSTKQVRVIQLLQETDNAIGLAAKWLVKLNQGIAFFTSAASAS